MTYVLKLVGRSSFAKPSADRKARPTFFGRTLDVWVGRFLGAEPCFLELIVGDLVGRDAEIVEHLGAGFNHHGRAT